MSPSIRRTLSSPAFAVPTHLDRKLLTGRKYLSSATGNLHGLRSEDYLRIQCPMPKMFGDEKYAFSLIDIDDPRYIEETTRMSSKLVRFFYDVQIMENEWRKTYKRLLNAEHQRDSLPPSATQATRTEMDKLAEKAKKYLLTIQDQLDLYRACINEIWARCDDIKAVIKKENDLEELRKEMTNRVKRRFGNFDDFWRVPFEVRSCSPSPKGRESVNFDDVN